MARRIAVPAIAFGMTIAYGAWLQPEWEPIRDDQQQYLALAHGLADRGEFTRAVAGEPFIPEPLRAPGYPALLAVLCRTVGCGHWPVVIAQALLFAMLVMLVAALAKRTMSPRAALVATVLVAAYPPLAFFAALILSDLFATALIAVAGYALMSGGTRGMAMTGLALGLAALTRPFFLLIAIPFAVVASWRGSVPRRQILALLGTFVLAVAPLFLYSFAVFRRPFTGSSGTQLWLGYFQFRGTDLDTFERSEAEGGAARIKAFVAERDRSKQPAEFLQLDADLGSRAVRLIAHDPLGYAARAMPRSVELWAGDLPVKEGIALPVDARAVVLSGELVLLVFGIAGAIVLARRSTSVAGALPLTVIGYVWILSLPLWAEERFSLPAKPFLVVAAVAGAAALMDRRRRRSA